jgi:alpha-glucosidase
MKRLIAWLLVALAGGLVVRETSMVVDAIELNGLTPIGPVERVVKDDAGVTLECTDASQVRIAVLTSDLIRVRASFREALPSRDQSWAIAGNWPAPKWSMTERADEVTIETGEVTVRVQRSPLLVEFRDRRTGRIVNADERPMMSGPNGRGVAAAKRLGFDEHFLGLGEKAARLDKRRGQFQMWNMDTPGYTEGTDPIYQSIPFYIGLDRGLAYGIFFDNSYRTHFDFGASGQEYAAFSADGGEMNYYFFYGPSMKKVVSRYADLTGHMPMPPAWALGHQQSRWSYYPDTLAEKVVAEYRARDLPLDVLHLDIHYMRDYRVFTWDRSRFPDPSAFTARLLKQGVKVVTIVDPGIKYQPAAEPAAEAPMSPELGDHSRSYYVFDQGLTNGFFQRRQNGSLYIGRVWPGESVFVDYTMAAARRWWGDLFRAYTDHGVAGIWTDMNEPSDFVDRDGKDKADLVYDDGGTKTLHDKNRNVFALLMARATREGLERLQPDTRPFVITRAGYAGIQRYSTMWTGDNTSTWEALALNLPMFASLGLSGQPFVGADVGGFIGRADGELLVRGYQVGFLTPFFRNHHDLTGYDQEPWRFGPYYEGIIRKYLKLRYRLMPFLYTQLEAASRTGLPIFRPIVLNYPDDPTAPTLDDEFMVGDELLVAPVLKPDVVGRRVYLPAGTWVDFWTGARLEGGMMVRAAAPLETVPLFVRAGSILPLGPEMNFVGERPADPLTLAVYPDDQGRASTILYEDDGVSPAYASGMLRRTAIDVTLEARATVIHIAAPRGPYQPGPRVFAIVCKSVARPSAVEVDGARLVQSATGVGWSVDGEDTVVRIRDEGRARRITLASAAASSKRAK